MIVLGIERLRFHTDVRFAIFRHFFKLVGNVFLGSVNFSDDAAAATAATAAAAAAAAASHSAISTEAFDV